jgi:membrane protein required for colicin V production
MMYNFNWADVAVLMVLTLFTVRGLLRGFVRSMFDFLALGIAIYLAFYWYGDFALFLSAYLKAPLNIIQIASFIAVWFIAFFITTTIGGFVHKLIGKTIFGPANVIGGALLGATKGLLFIWLILQIVFMLPLPQEATGYIRTAISIEALNPMFNEIPKLFSGIMPKAEKENPNKKILLKDLRNK